MSNFIPEKYHVMLNSFVCAHLCRLRMAQEIQRKLEETEVKQRELESRGVSVEKALGGEGGKISFSVIDIITMKYNDIKKLV